jgi:DNA-binding NarL/FixJ family response regulator
MEQEVAKIDVLIGGPPTLFRQGLTSLLHGQRPGWQLVEMNSFDSVMDHLREHAPALILLDTQTPGMNGLAGLRQLCALSPMPRILLLADSDDRSAILDCIGAGARGYLAKSAAPEQVLCALNTVLAGCVFAPASLIGNVQASTITVRTIMPEAPRPSLAALTDRQREVFDLLAQGFATKSIARRLDLAVGTVKVHLAAIYRTLDAHSRTEAMAKAGGMVLPMMLTPIARPADELLN